MYVRIEIGTDSDTADIELVREHIFGNTETIHYSTTVVLYKERQRNSIYI